MSYIHRSYSQCSNPESLKKCFIQHHSFSIPGILRSTVWWQIPTYFLDCHFLIIVWHRYSMELLLLLSTGRWKFDSKLWCMCTTIYFTIVIKTWRVESDWDEGKQYYLRTQLLCNACRECFPQLYVLHWDMQIANGSHRNPLHQQGHQQFLLHLNSSDSQYHLNSRVIRRRLIV